MVSGGAAFVGRASSGASFPERNAYAMTDWRPVDRAKLPRELACSDLAGLAARVLSAAQMPAVAMTSVDRRQGTVVLRLQPAPRIAELLGTRDDVICYVVDGPYLTDDVLHHVESFVRAEAACVSSDVAFVVARSPETARLCHTYSEGEPTAMVGLTAADLRACAPYGARSLVRVIQHRFYHRDLYAYSSPVRESASFFGRRALVNEMVATLRRAANNVGIFGLRRMGKTSLLYRVHSQLKETGAAFVAHLDLERIDAIEASAEYFLWSLGEAIFDSHRAVRAIGGFRMFGVSSTIADIDRAAIPEAFRHDLTRVLEHIRRPLVISIDELEMMFPEIAVNPGWSACFVRIWRLLRGISQEHERKLAFLVAGTNPRPIEAAKAAGGDNPIYQWIDINFLRPLERAESVELLQSIGSRMGLDWLDDAAQSVYEKVGGHPFLTRAFGSHVHEQLLPRDTEVVVNADTVNTSLAAFVRERSKTLEQILQVLEEQYEDEHLMLELLATGKLGEFRAYADMWPEKTHHLRGYGLVDLDRSIPTIRIELLQTFMQRRLRAQRSIPTERKHSLMAGDVIGSDEFRVEYSVGVKSAYSDVYRAICLKDMPPLAAGQTVALKVLKEGATLQQLQREVEAISCVKHPNIVEMYDYGTDVTGRHYVVMEYLDGPTLSERCERSSRLGQVEAISVLRKLLSALTAIHPDVGEIDRARSHEVQSNSDLEVSSRARHGYIHRDIKPDNVLLVKHRGPVLIDFNISSKAGVVRETSTSTPGFVRPTVRGERWQPAHDLYGLGVTMACAIAGVMQPAFQSPLEQEAGVRDLLALVAESVSDPLLSVLRRLCSLDAAESFSDARAALAALDVSAVPSG